MLILAEELVQKKGPAEFRSAISRGYYAEYNVADQFLERMGFQRSKFGAHVLVQTRLLNSGDAEVMKIGSDLGGFHTRRNKADYDMNDLFSEQEVRAAGAVGDGKKMIAALDAIPIYGQRWKQIQAAILKAGV